MSKEKENEDDDIDGYIDVSHVRYLSDPRAFKTTLEKERYIEMD